MDIKQLAESKPSALSTTGSFYYEHFVGDAVKDAHKLTHIPYNTRVFKQVYNAFTSALSEEYYSDNFLLIRFQDSDINYYGIEGALASRKPGEELVIADRTALDTGEDSLLANQFSAIVLFPYATDTTISVTGGEGTYLPFGLTIPENILVHTIRGRDGKTLISGKDFVSKFGYLLFRGNNPIHLFPDMQFMVTSYTERRPNILCYPLGVVNVYGDVSKILSYYRFNQTPKSFYLAAAQACGLKVVKKSGVIAYADRLPIGHYYVVDDIRYDVPFPHTQLPVGTNLTEGEVIAADQIFTCILPGDNVPDTITSISLDTACPVLGVTIPNSTIAIFDNVGAYRPAYTGNVNAYHAYLRNNPATTSLLGEPNATANGIEHFRNTVCGGNKCIIACISRDMPEANRLRLLEFINRETPVGAVLTFAEI